MARGEKSQTVNARESAGRMRVQCSVRSKGRHSVNPVNRTAGDPRGGGAGGRGLGGLILLQRVRHDLQPRRGIITRGPTRHNTPVNRREHTLFPPCPSAAQQPRRRPPCAIYRSQREQYSSTPAVESRGRRDGELGGGWRGMATFPAWVYVLVSLSQLEMLTG